MASKEKNSDYLAKFLGRGAGRQLTSPEAKCSEGLGQLPAGEREGGRKEGSPPGRWHRCRAPRTCPQMDVVPLAAPSTRDAASVLHGPGLAARTVLVSAELRAPRLPRRECPGHDSALRHASPTGREINWEALSAAHRVAAGRGDGAEVHIGGKKRGTEMERERRKASAPESEVKTSPLPSGIGCLPLGCSRRQSRILPLVVELGLSITLCPLVSVLGLFWGWFWVVFLSIF